MCNYPTLNAVEPLISLVSRVQEERLGILLDILNLTVESIQVYADASFVNNTVIKSKLD